MKTIQEIRARFEVLTHSQCWSKHTAANDFTNSYVQWLEDEIIRFDQQNKELREKVKALDDHRIKIEEMELAERNRANKAKAEIQRLTKEVEELKKSVTPDPFLYPINSAKLKELVWKLDREIWAKVEAKEATTSWGREQTSFLISQYFGQSSNELTRLRELLVRSNDLISDYEHRFSEFDPNKRDLLVRDIDNALNPKP